MSMGTVVSEKIDLKTWCKQNNHEDLLVEWNYEKNSPLNPENVAKSSHINVWWKCTIGHDFQSPISYRTRLDRRDKCPYCSGKRVLTGFNDLESVHPEIAKEWNYSKNNGLLPSKIVSGSTKKVWWKCSKGHEWQTSVAQRSLGRNCPYCSNQKLLKGYNDLASSFPVVAQEWNYAKNNGLLPSEVVYGSSKKVWWKCTKCKHEWETAVRKRTIYNTGCPICANINAGKKHTQKRVNKSGSFEDWCIKNHQIAILEEWDYNKNSEIHPEQVSKGSGKKVWWKCSKCKFEWKAPIANRTGKNNTGCPSCANKVANLGNNDLQTENPALCKEWSFSKNGDLTPCMVNARTQKKVWWKCIKGHEWQASVSSRVKGSGCPVCAGRQVLVGYNDLATTNNELLKDWDYDKNVGLLPTEVFVRSHREVWWKCSVCGYEWKSSVRERTSGQKCPCCRKEKRVVSEVRTNRRIVNSLQDEYPDISQEWNYEKNGNLKPDNISSHSAKKVWWKCSKDHEWKASVYSRTSGHTRCPICNSYGTSLPEFTVYYYLSKLIRTTEHRSKPFGFELDVYIPDCKIGIEYDGSAWHNSKEARIKEDIKNEKCHNNGITLIRIKESNRDTIENNVVYFRWDPDYTNIGFAINSIIQMINQELDQNFSLDVNWLRDRDVIEAAYRETINYPKNSITVENPELAREWNLDKNGSLKPDQFSIKSNRAVWWKCPHNHEWKAQISVRALGVGCPVCANLKVIPGINDLASQRPELLKEWDNGKNGDLRPSDVVYGSPRRVWWKCSVCGYEWQTAIRKRANDKTGCPCCVGKRVCPGINDIATTNPDILKDWNYEKNGNLKPTMVTKGSSKRVWWKCSLCGFEWQTSVSNRARLGSGCRRCKAVGPKKVKNLDTGKEFDSIGEAEEYYNISHGKISMCCKGTRKTAGGYHWNYITNADSQKLNPEKND